MRNKEKNTLPCIECGGKCCCYAPISVKEWEKIKARFPIGDDAIVMECFQGTPKHAVIVYKARTDKVCYYLKDGRCSIYNYRPKTCREVASDGVCAFTNADEVMRRLLGIKARTGHTFLSERR
jgi:Fe-S-cluster containining protein